ncbi:MULTISPECIES: metallophosphoesterase [Pontibacillus]|uniref:Metallophosphoesterase n=1 Tax=Pontibacillus chungwhensis TaxID=265426 RepID=A0ABY8UUF0_9BACI|nr:metallophosphoesterase [Pontibacillus chungwhensis]MCD5323289.1 metallophosphoesterase [Pontibacillus sp. HN14]WIF96672.1 metallophosphoesterase [Pontibacillus chungwhensis]
MDKIQELHIPSGKRVIVTSDIHGEAELLQDLLTEVGFNEEDYLIINGDLCEKGANSWAVVQFVMKLQQSHPHVYVTEGNCDVLVHEIINHNQNIIPYLLQREKSLINEWLRFLKVEIAEDTDIKDIQKFLTAHFQEEMNWLLGLPTAIETKDYIFVHAALEYKTNWRQTKRSHAIKDYSFMDKGHLAPQYVVVGHWPVVNYSKQLLQHNPIMDHELKVISIDGGNVIKKSGQLNAFIIHKEDETDRFTYQSVDHLPKIRIHTTYKAQSEPSRVITYPDYELDIISKGEDFTHCLHKSSENRLYVKNEMIIQTENGLYKTAGDASGNELNVCQGDYVSLVDDSKTGYSLIKKEGVVGWVPHTVLEKGDSVVTTRTATSY